MFMLVVWVVLVSMVSRVGVKMEWIIFMVFFWDLGIG